MYRFSPYDLVWNNDCCYIFGWSLKHDKIVKFRVDRMYQPKLSAVAYHPRPNDYDISDYCERVFMMYEGKPCKVKLLCDNSLIYTILDGLKNRPMEYDEQIVRQLLECITVDSKEQITVIFVGDLKVVQPLID